MSWLRNQPLFNVLLIVTCLLMYLPMLYAGVLENWLIARTFFYHATFFLIISGLIGIAFANRPLNSDSASRLLDLSAAFVVLPVVMALPVAHLVPQFSFLNTYFEMLSSFTTTGASIYDNPFSIPDTIHLWRGMTSWLGGLLILVAAMAILQPINLGGFEVYATRNTAKKGDIQIQRRDVRSRSIRYFKIIFPIYLGLTFILTLLLSFSGDRLLVAAIHAMSTISTSGISSVGGLQNSNSGLIGEAFVFLFLFTAVSRFAFQQDLEGHGFKRLRQDKEINLMLFATFIIAGLLFIRHWGAVQELGELGEGSDAASAFWGSLFTVASFMTTTGFESASWGDAKNWSGLSTTGLILMGLAVMGGGIATTAGGVKLLRIYALYKHGVREMDRLTFPSSVGGSGIKARSIRRDGAYNAWIFLMIFLVSIAVVMLLLSATGISFENSLVLSISALTNTGPLLGLAGDTGLKYSELPDIATVVLCLAMVLGRLETLAVIAIFNPNYWKN